MWYHINKVPSFHISSYGVLSMKKVTEDEFNTPKVQYFIPTVLCFNSSLRILDPWTFIHLPFFQALLLFSTPLCSFSIPTFFFRKVDNLFQSSWSLEVSRKAHSAFQQGRSCKLIVPRSVLQGSSMNSKLASQSLI